jgi:hypothetical protein
VAAALGLGTCSIARAGCDASRLRPRCFFFYLQNPDLRENGFTDGHNTSRESTFGSELQSHMNFEARTRGSFSPNW